MGIKSKLTILKSLTVVGLDKSGESYKEYDREGRILLHRYTNNPEFLPLEDISQNYLKVEDRWPLHIPEEGHEERWTYDENGRESSYRRINQTGMEYREDYTYVTDDEGNLWQQAKINDREDGPFTMRVTDKDGRTLYDTFTEWKHGPVYSFIRNDYDSSGRLIDSYENDGKGVKIYHKHYDYSDNGNKHITRITERIFRSSDGQVDLLTPKNWEEDEEPNDQVIVEEWNDQYGKWKVQKSEMNDNEESISDAFDRDGKLFVRTIIEKSRGTESRVIHTFNKDGNIIDITNYFDGRLSSHTVHHYSENGKDFSLYAYFIDGRGRPSLNYAYTSYTLWD